MKSVFLKDLGMIFRSVRRQSGYTQGELADLLGTTRQTVYNFENGDHFSKRCADWMYNNVLMLWRD